MCGIIIKKDRQGEKQMKKLIPFLLAVFVLAGCSSAAKGEAGNTYRQVTANEAALLMETFGQRRSMLRNTYRTQSVSRTRQ